MARTLVVGLDGATFDVLDPLMEDGTMPNLAALREGAAEARLQSTMPPVTGPAWLSLATGLSPGSTGIYDFIYRSDSDGYNFSYLDSSMFQGRSLWDYLSDNDHSVGVIDYPLVSAYPINGFMSCGGLGSGGYDAYPEQLERELTSFEQPKAHLDLRDPKYEDLGVFVEEISENLQRRADILEYTLEQRSWDFCWAVLQETDWFQHVMWKCFDETHPEAESVTDEERAAFRRFWREVDDVIARCIAHADDDTNIVIQSDHGFGTMYDRSFRLNTWLKDQGYLEPKSYAASQFWIKKRLRNLLSDAASSIQLKDRAPDLFQWGKNKTASMAIQVNAIDFERTRVLDPGHIGSMGGLYINEQALGPDENVETIKNEVRGKLEEFGEENDLSINVYYPEEIYGKKAATSPDMIIRVDGVMIENGGWDKPVLDKRPDRLDHQNGSHRRDGVLLATGPDFEPCFLEEAHVWDLAPTLLHCFGLAVPEKMDGQVLLEAMDVDESVRYTSEYQESDGRMMTDSEQDRIESQLSDLGYFE